MPLHSPEKKPSCDFECFAQNQKQKFHSIFCSAAVHEQRIGLDKSLDCPQAAYFFPSLSMCISLPLFSLSLSLYFCLSSLPPLLLSLTGIASNFATAADDQFQLQMQLFEVCSTHKHTNTHTSHTYIHTHTYWHNTPTPTHSHTRT